MEIINLKLSNRQIDDLYKDGVILRWKHTIDEHLILVNNEIKCIAKYFRGNYLLKPK